VDSLKNMKNRNYLIEAIRKKTIELKKENWYIEYTPGLRHMQGVKERNLLTN
jgi:hypothetical protein